jgi:pyrroline-5-carboxylate reductase
MRLVMIGCGAMGQAMVMRWLDASWLEHIAIVKPSALPAAFAMHERVEYIPHAAACRLESYDVVIWAVKPQIMAEVMDGFAHVGEPLHMTIAAALPLAWYEQRLGSNARILRAMPNTPVAVGQGMVGLVANAQMTTADRLYVEQMMQRLGSYHWLQDEAAMELFTAIAGCGPAYVFAWMQAWCEAAVAQGMPYEDARTIIAHTVRGSVALSEQFRDDSLNALVDRVTSKGGMTEAALQQLDKNHQWHDGFASALEAALRRASALSAPENGCAALR